MARTTNPADLVLSDALAQRGIAALPRRLETMRQAGMLEERRRSGLGRGLGSHAAVGEDEVDRAEYMARLLDEWGSYPDAVLAAFVRDEYPIPRHRLAEAYDGSIGRVLRSIGRYGGPSALDNALNAASKAGRYLSKERRFRPVRERARHLGLVHRYAPMHRVMFDLAADVILLVIVGDKDPRRTAEAAMKVEVFTGDGTIEDSTPPAASTAACGLQFSELGRRLRLEALPWLVSSATMPELTGARDAVKTFRAFAREYGPFADRRAGTGRAFVWLVVGMASDRVVAWSIPAFVLVRRAHGARFDAMISFFADWTPFFRAANVMLEAVPPQLQFFARPNGYESLTADERRELLEHITRLESTHSEEVKVLRNPPVVPQNLG